MCNNISEFVGKSFKKVEVVGEEAILFHTNSETFKMFHQQDCCEGVYIEDICGDLNDLCGSQILRASEDVSGERPLGTVENEYRDESETWTFYNISTNKGSVTIRWYGTSNGYYSERVSIIQIK